MFLKLTTHDCSDILVKVDNITDIFRTGADTRICFNVIDSDGDQHYIIVRESLEEIQKLIEKGNRLGCGVVGGDK